MLYCKKYCAESSPFCSRCFRNSPDTYGSIAFSLVSTSIFDYGSRHDLVFHGHALRVSRISVLVSSAMRVNVAPLATEMLVISQEPL
jgi:hypothetical protein